MDLNDIKISKVKNPKTNQHQNTKQQKIHSYLSAVVKSLNKLDKASFQLT